MEGRTLVRGRRCRKSNRRRAVQLKLRTEARFSTRTGLSNAEAKFYLSEGGDLDGALRLARNDLAWEKKEAMELLPLADRQAVGAVPEATRNEAGHDLDSVDGGLGVRRELARRTVDAAIKTALLAA